MLGGGRFREGAYIERDEAPLSGVTQRVFYVQAGETPANLCEPLPFEA